MGSSHYFTFWFQVPRVLATFTNWHHYLWNYLTRAKSPCTYLFRTGHELTDSVGTLAGTLAVVYVRREYGIPTGAQTIVDVGANMGAFSLFAAQRCPNARILAYEPASANYRSLKDNIERNGLSAQILAIQAAVVGKSGPVRLNLSESPLHSVDSTGLSSVHEDVRGVELAQTLEENGLEHVDFLKLNCEGAEYEILRSVPQTVLDTIDVIRLEYHNLDTKERNGQALARLLTTRGWKVERFTTYRRISGFIWARRRSQG